MTTTDECQTCHGSEWVCEIHPDQAWSGASLHPDACPEGCIGPGMPCQCSHLSRLQSEANSIAAGSRLATGFIIEGEATPDERTVRSLPDTGRERLPLPPLGEGPTGPRVVTIDGPPEGRPT